jgi:hypothetical protein
LKQNILFPFFLPKQAKKDEKNDDAENGVSKLQHTGDSIRRFNHRAAKRL